MKLKQILTPISPHLKAPRPERDPRLAQRETPIPAPRAVPIEPEPEPDPEALKAEREGTTPAAPLPPESSAGPSPEQPESQPEQAEAPPGEETGDESAEQPGEETTEEDTFYEDLPQKKTPNWSRRLLIWLVLPVALVGAIAWLVLFILKPAPGETVTAVQPQAGTAVQRANPQPAAAKADLGPVELTLALENQTLESYLQQFQQQEIVASTNPRGIFVNSVFIPEGSPVNPRFGLILVQVEPSPEGTLIDLVDADRQPYRIALSR